MAGSSKARTFALVLALGLAPLHGQEGIDQEGVEVLTPRFRVLAELPTEAALQAAEHLETAHASLKALGFYPRPAGFEPIPVLLLPDVDQLETLFGGSIVARGFARGLFQPGVDRSYIVLGWDPPETARTALSHEYVHWVFKDLSQPLWYREGLAEFLSRSVLLENGAVFGSPAMNFLNALEREKWVPLAELMSAKREREMVTYPTFYGQCWLIVHWLASGGELRDPRRYRWVQQLVEAGGGASVEAQLREHLEGLLSGAVNTTTARLERPDRASFAVRPLAGWEWSYYKADAWREAYLWRRAEKVLRRIEKEFPLPPEPSEALGALLMDRREYERAERALARAVAKGSVNPRTHYRYSLMLLRPVAGGPDVARLRAASARDHARKALDRQPGEPTYILTLAQSLGLLGEWSTAAGQLSSLAAHPAWRQLAVEEFDVLIHRQRQYVTKISPPRLDALEADHLDWTFLQKQPEQIAEPPPPPKKPEAWPPPGTVLLYGHIVKVECLGKEKFVTVRTPRWRARFRERADTPAKLYSPPENWRTSPCEAKGWEVNVAYRPNLRDRGVRGDLVAIVF